MNLQVVINTNRRSSIIPPPSGYGVYRALNWGEGALNQEASVGTALYGTSTFAYVPVYIPETTSFSSVNNASLYDRSKGDMDALWNMQPKDGRTKNQNFNPLVFQGNATLIWWTGDNVPWDTAPVWYAGSQLQAGQMYAATLETFQVWCQLPGGSGKSYQTCRKVLPFRRSDFGKSFEQYPYLINKYAVAFQLPHADSMSTTFNGLTRYMPLQCLDPRDFRFASSQTQPSAFYVPVQWGVPVTI